MTNETEARKNCRKVMRGVVTSDKTLKTRVVSVEHTVMHGVYGKTLRRSHKFYAHDEKNESHIGDLVEITSVRPMSSLKRWRVSRIVEKSAK